MPQNISVSRIVALRTPGFIGAAFFLTATLLGNMLASDEGDLLSTSELTLWRLGALAIGLPLLLPWRWLASSFGWRVLISWLWVDAIVVTCREGYEVFSLFGRRSCAVWVMDALPFEVFLVAGVWMAVLAAVAARKSHEYVPAQA